MKNNEQPGIEFEKVVLERVNLEINPDFSMKVEGIPVEISFKVISNLVESQKLLKVSLDVALFQDTENPPLRASLLITGYFSVKKVEDLKTLKKFAHVQAPALVFPFVRETIADLTVRAGYPPLLLPPTNITALIGNPPKKQVKQKNI